MIPILCGLLLTIAYLSRDPCGFIQGDHICLRPKNHTGEHKTEPINHVVPFVNQ